MNKPYALKGVHFFHQNSNTSKVPKDESIAINIQVNTVLSRTARSAQIVLVKDTIEFKSSNTKGGNGKISERRTRHRPQLTETRRPENRVQVSNGDGKKETGLVKFEFEKEIEFVAVSLDKEDIADVCIEGFIFSCSDQVGISKTGFLLTLTSLTSFSSCSSSLRV